jgi:threonine synthase
MSAYLQCFDEACGDRYPLRANEHLCERCGGLLEARYEDAPAADPNTLRETWRHRKFSSKTEDQSGVWRFREFLPFINDTSQIVTLAEGNTPLLEVPEAASWAGGLQLLIKHQGTNPTGSFKDLGMTACVTAARMFGNRVIACASTGNTSASMSAYAARAGMKAVVFVPAGKISAAKLAQAIEFGATVLEIAANFDEALQLLRSIRAEMGLYVVNSINPFRLEGQKTIVCEILEQREWKVPEYLVVPGGNLGNVSAIAKGLFELKDLGLISTLPHLVVVQAEGANPFYRMWAQKGAAIEPTKNPSTDASAIRIGDPVNWKKAQQALRRTNGLCESVSDDEIFAAKEALARDGVGCEPASAATLAGLKKLVHSSRVEPGADVVAVLTGHQLKDPESGVKRREAIDLARQLIRVEPEIKKLRAALENVISAESHLTY